jgi:hypothetical protein
MGKKRRPPLRLLEDVVEPKAKEVKTSLCSYNFIILDHELIDRHIKESISMHAHVV